MGNKTEAKTLNENELKMVNGGAVEINEEKMLEQGGKNYAKDLLDKYPNGSLNNIVMDATPPADDIIEELKS